MSFLSDFLGYEDSVSEELLRKEFPYATLREKDSETLLLEGLFVPHVPIDPDKVRFYPRAKIHLHEGKPCGETFQVYLALEDREVYTENPAPGKPRLRMGLGWRAYATLEGTSTGMTEEHALTECLEHLDETIAALSRVLPP